MGFWEFIVIAIVATVVLGPDKLPVAIRKLTQIKRKIAQLSQGVTAEVNEQLRIHELHENLKKAEQMGMQDLPENVKASVDELKSAAQSVNQPATKKPIDE